MSSGSYPPLLVEWELTADLPRVRDLVQRCSSRVASAALIAYHPNLGLAQAPEVGRSIPFFSGTETSTSEDWQTGSTGRGTRLARLSYIARLAPRQPA